MAKLSEIDIWDVLLLILKHVHIHGSFIMSLCFLLSSVQEKVAFMKRNFFLRCCVDSSKYGLHLIPIQCSDLVKHLEKICSVCGGHLISINFPPRNWEGYYA
jgi:hypothetical protein